MPSDSLYEHTEDLVAWAHDAIDVMRAEWHGFVSEASFPRIREYRPDGSMVDKIVQRAKMPGIIERKATEALNNTRNAFDQALYAFLLANGLQPDSANYPWSTSPRDLTAKMRGKDPENPKIPERLWGAIRELHPYPTSSSWEGGDTLVRQMATLANRKHTVGIRPTPAPVAVRHPQLDIEMQDGGRVYVSGPGAWDHKRGEMVILRAMKSKVFRRGMTNVSFSIAFDVGPPVKNVTAMRALRNFAHAAERAIEHFKSRS